MPCFSLDATSWGVEHLCREVAQDVQRKVGVTGEDVACSDSTTVSHDQVKQAEELLLCFSRIL